MNLLLDTDASILSDSIVESPTLDESIWVRRTFTICRHDDRIRIESATVTKQLEEPTDLRRPPFLAHAIVDLNSFLPNENPENRQFNIQ